MAILIKTSGEAPEGAKKIYRDAIVTEGSALLIDFSNRGTVPDNKPKNGQNILDLAREPAFEMGLENSIELIINNPSYELTAGYGLNLKTLGSVYANVPKKGVHFGTDLLTKLSQWTNDEIVIIQWLARKPGTAIKTGEVINSNSSNKGYPYRGVLNGTGGLVATIAGTALPANNIYESATQQTFHYQGEGKKIKQFCNTETRPDSVNNATGFGTPSESLKWGDMYSGGASIEQGLDIALYRVYVENITVSGRTALEVMQKDYNYCHGTGEFSGTGAKRPFTDTY